jgi:hypothetical protein
MLWIVAVMVLASAACSKGAPAGPQARTGERVVRVTERDFHITAPARLPPGDALIQVTNNGPVAHEFIMVRATDRQMTLRADGITVDEQALLPVTVGSLTPGRAGLVRTLRVHLVPGHYVFFCNMAGHYMGGMDTAVIVG